MELSARSQLPGTVKSVSLGGIIAEVSVDVEGHEVVATIMRGSAEHRKLRAGDTVTVIVKSTEVMIGK